MVATRATALNQLIAVRKGVQAQVHGEVTRLRRESQKPQLMSGLSRTYQKINDEDPDLPGEAQRVQLTVEDVLDGVRAQMVRLWDLTATVDVTNCEARGQIVIGDRTVSLPVSSLLFLEKQLTNLHTLVEALTELDPNETWSWDGVAGMWVTAPTTTVRSKKVPRNHVLAEATEKHPAQVQVWHEDVPVGYWNLVKFSGAISRTRKVQLLARVVQLREAVKMAREQANATTVKDVAVADAMFDHILA